MFHFTFYPFQIVTCCIGYVHCVIIICSLDHFDCSCYQVCVYTVYYMFRSSSWIVFSYSAFLLPECSVQFSSVQPRYVMLLSALISSPCRAGDAERVKRMMQYVSWPAGGSVPCQSCVQAQMLVNVLRQGMHPVCVDACLPHYQHAAHPLQVY